MRRSINLLLVLALMLQLTWAASVRFCDHAHVGQSTTSAPATVIPYSSGDLDCGTCHLGFGALFVAMLSVPSVELKEKFGLGAMQQMLSAISSAPYRPKWLPQA
jgi:hypothetical protein